MKYLHGYSDVRLKGECIHCESGLDTENSSRDHVPTKALLDKPYPENLPVTAICKQCNSSFSKDEDYLAVFLASVLCGSTEFDSDRFPTAAKILNRSADLRERVNCSRRVQLNLEGNEEIQWVPENDRVTKVISKNARGHVFYELGQPAMTEPTSVDIVPLQNLSNQQRHEFERGEAEATSIWPEVGSRLMQRVAGGFGMDGNGWIEVQTDVYRYAVEQSLSGISVRIVHREYLAAEIHWND